MSVKSQFEFSTPQATGDFIKNLRLAHNMTQDNLGDELFISRKAVSKWENGICYPSIDLMMKISDLFGVTLEEILVGKFLSEDAKNEVESIKFITKLFKSRNTKLMIRFSIFVCILSLVIYFFENYNATKVYNVWYEDDNFYFLNGMIVTTPFKDYFNFGNFSVDLTDIDENTQFEVIIYKRNKDGTRENLVSYKSKRLYYFENNEERLAPIKIKNRLKHLYMKVEYTNIYGEEKEYILHLKVELSYQNNDLKELKNNVNTKFDPIENKVLKIEADGYNSIYKIIDLAFLDKIIYKETTSLFNKSIKDADYILKIYDEYILLLESSKYIITLDLSSKRIYIKQKNSDNENVVFTINEFNKVIIKNDDIQYYEIMNNSINYLKSLVMLP